MLLTPRLIFAVLMIRLLALRSLMRVRRLVELLAPLWSIAAKALQIQDKILRLPEVSLMDSLTCLPYLVKPLSIAQR